MSPRVSGFRKALVAAVALAAALAVPASALAATIGGGLTGTATITVRPSVALLNKVGVTATVDITCSGLSTQDPNTGFTVPTDVGYIQSLNLIVAQKSGRQVAQAVGGLGGPTQVLCDGSDNVLQVDALSQNFPLKAGAAVANANVFITDLLFVSSASAGSGNVAVMLVKM